MAEGKIRVKFEAKGDKGLIDAIKSLNRETKKLRGINVLTERSVDKLSKAKGQQRRNTEKLDISMLGLGKTLSTARAKMLLYAFAVTQATQLVNKLVRTNARIEDMGRAFNNLAESAGFSSDTFDKLNEAVDGTVRKTDLMQQANNAMLLGIFESSDQMAKMFDVAQRLGQALGRTANESIESLVTGLGRQSKLMLDNLGIVFSVDKAYAEYANTLNKNVEALTDQERKQAFTNKAMEIANDLVAKSGDEVLSTNANLDNFTVSWERFQSALGKFVTPAILGTTSALGGLLDETARALEIMSDDKGFGKFLDIDAALISKDYQLLEQAFGSVNSQLTNLVGSFGGVNDAMKKAKELGISQNSEFTDLIELFKQLNRELVRQFDPWEQWVIHVNNAASKVQFAKLEIKELNDELAFNKVKVSEVSEATIKYTDFQRKLSASVGLLPEEIQSLTINAQQGARAVGAISQAMVAMAGDNKDRIVQGLRLAKLAAVADSIAGASKSFAQGGFAGFTGGIAMLASMMQRISTIDQQIAQAQAEKFETGGLIGGRRHSQGGTLIEAERGEFVMSRNAVSAIGVENLNRMNQGQSGSGSINISINGGMISPDFVENELAESIREAVRRGADFGIS